MKLQEESMNQKPNFNEEDEVEIDLLELFYALRHRLWMVILAAIIGGGIFGAFSKFVLTPQYQSTTMLYILSKETTLTSLADLQIGSQLTQDYKIIIVSRPVLEEVIQKLGLNLDYDELKAKLTIDNPTNTRILSITAQDADPAIAKSVADTVGETASSYIGDIMEMVPPKIIERGIIPTRKSSPSNTKNAVIGAVIGIFLACGAVVLEVIMNDTVVTEEDVARYLDLTVLASVPARKEDIVLKEKDKARKKSRRKNR